LKATAYVIWMRIDGNGVYELIKKTILNLCFLFALVLLGTMFTDVGLSCAETSEADIVTASQSVDVYDVIDEEAIEDFVTRFYVQCLDREPDQDGLDYWVNKLESGEMTGADVAEGFVFSTEFTGLGLSDEDYLEVLYRAFFDRDPDTQGLNYWLGELNDGTSRLVVLAGFVNADEFGTMCDNYGITRGSIDVTREQVAAFVTRFYEQCLDRAPDQLGLDYWVNRLVSVQTTGAKAAYGFVFSDEFLAEGVADEAYVDILYRAFFDRAGDSDGRTFWLGRMTSGVSRLEVLAGFVNSGEFKALCADFGIEAGLIDESSSIHRYMVQANGSTAIFTVGSSNYILNGFTLTMDRYPMMSNGNLCAPVQQVVFNDDNVAWEAATGTFTMIRGDKVVQLVVGSKTMLVNSVPVSIDTAPFISASYVYMPVKPIVEAFGGACKLLQ